MTFARFVATGAGAGLLPRAPGTWGSLAATVAGMVLLRLGGRKAVATGALGATLAGLWAIPRVGGGADPGWVVVDEVAGQLIAMLPLDRPKPMQAAIAFALFRAFDISKPGPIGRVDRLEGRVGVMGDDILAGGVAAIVLWAGSRLGSRRC